MTDINNVSLNEFYSWILASSMQADGGDGRILQAVNPQQVTDKPVLVRDRQLVLPLTSILKNPSEKEIVFHPLSEQITRGHSTIFKHIRRMGTLQLSTAITNVGFALLKLQEHPEIMRQMTPEQQQAMIRLVDTDKSSADAWTKMAIQPIKEDPTRTDKWLINLFVKNNGHYNGGNYRRVCVVNFPAFEHVASGKKFTRGEGADEKAIGRTKDYLMFQQMAETLFPGWENTTEFNAGYDGATGPNLVTFLRSYKKIADRLNALIDLFKAPFENAQVGDVSSFRIPTDWEQLVCTEAGIDVLAQLARRVPGLKGNIGDVNGREDIDDEDEAIKQRDEKQRATPAKPQSTPVKVEDAKTEVKPDDSGLTPEHIRLRDEAIERRKRYEADEREWAERRKQREQEPARRDDRYDRDYRNDRRDDRDYRYDDRDGRDYRRDDRDYRRDERDERDPPREEVSKNGSISFSAIRKANRAIGENSDERDDRGYRGGRGRDDRDYRRDDRDYRRDDRDYRRDDRDYRRDDRGYRGGRDSRDYRRDDRGGRYRR